MKTTLSRRTGRADGQTAPLPRGPCGSAASAGWLRLDRRAAPGAKPWRGRDNAAEGPRCPRSGSRLATFPQRGPSPTQTAGGAPSGIPRARQQTRTAGLRPALLTRRRSPPHSPDPQARTNPLTPFIVGVFALAQRQHHRTLRQPDDGARQPVEITARNDHFLAPEIGDDALLGATLLAYVLDQVDVGVGANALVASEHTLSI